MIDVAINVYGKPYQTAVTLLSLLRHSGGNVDRIFFIAEREQPRPGEYQIAPELIGERLISFTPDHYLGLRQADETRMDDESYRHSIRYQFAWERSRQRYLFLTHNDVLYTGDIIAMLTGEIGDSIGIGEVGQCWNCPASFAKVCSPERYYEFRPDREAAVRLHREFPSPRNYDHAGWIEHRGAWPLPECRLNEWVALIDLDKARPLTAPLGPAPPIGYLSVDTGTEWFRVISNAGHRVRNFDFTAAAKHAWTDGEFGNTSLHDDDRYDRSERIARDLLKTEFAVPESLLQKAVENDRPRARKIKNSIRNIKRFVKRVIPR